jgi:O-Antigen ligase
MTTISSGRASPKRVRPEAPPPAPKARTLASGHVDLRGIAIWVMALALVLYLAFNTGGYDLVVRNQVGIVVWWLVLLMALVGLLPARRLSRPAWAGLLLFAGFVLWTGLATTWSHSTERSVAELSRVVCYLGVLILATVVHRDRNTAVRLTVGAIATAVTIVAALAVFSRLDPGAIPGAQQTASLLPGTHGRLAWPVDYWNGLAALVALGFPLLLALVFTAKRPAVQALAAAAVPLLVLCAYLTFSRGGMIAMGGGILVFLALSSDRLPKLASALVLAGGGAAAIAGAIHRQAIENGDVGAVARHEGRQLLVALILICAGTGLAQAGIGLAVRHGRRPRWLLISKVNARRGLLAGVAIAIVIALLAGASSRVSHAWTEFKRPQVTALGHNTAQRFGSFSGNGRYTYWRVAVHASGEHLLGGWGPGTFPLVWLPRAPTFDYVENAHSLYVETLMEDGVVGLALLVAFLVVLIGTAVTRAVRSRDDRRVQAAGVAAAGVAFALSAASDWVWQIPVLPVCLLLLAGALFAADRNHASAETKRGRGSLGLRAAGVIVALACLVALVVPLSATTALRKSEAAAAHGDLPKALAYARDSAGIEPSAAAHLQEALVLESEGSPAPALRQAIAATADEPLNWATWFVRFRLEAENGQSAASLRSLHRADQLNPRSPLFRNL